MEEEQEEEARDPLQCSIDFDFFDLPIGEDKNRPKLNNATRNPISMQEEHGEYMMENGSNTLNLHAASDKKTKKHEEHKNSNEGADTFPVKEKRTDNASSNHTCERPKSKAYKSKHRKAMNTNAQQRHSSGDSIESNEQKPLKSKEKTRLVTSNFYPDSATSSSNVTSTKSESDTDLDSVSDSESGSDGEENEQESVSESDVTDVSPLSSSLSSLPSSLGDGSDEERNAYCSHNEDSHDETSPMSEEGNGEHYSFSSTQLKQISGKHKKCKSGKSTNSSNITKAMNSQPGTSMSNAKDTVENIPASGKHCRFTEDGNGSVEDLGLMIDTVLELRSKAHSRCSDSSMGSSLRSASSCSGGIGMSPRVAYSMNRKNHSFTNDDVKRIDKENQRLLKIIKEKRAKPVKKGALTHSAVKVRSSSFINRQKEHKRIAIENMAFLGRLESIKPIKSGKKLAKPVAAETRTVATDARNDRGGGKQSTSTKDKTNNPLKHQ